MVLDVTFHLSLKRSSVFVRPETVCVSLSCSKQVFDEYDDEVQDAEAAEAAVGTQHEEKDSELKPFLHKQRWGARGGRKWGAS